MQVSRLLPRSLTLLLAISSLAWGQSAPLQRLPAGLLDVQAPSARVAGVPGNLSILDRSCRAAPDHQLRARIVNAAIQEWAFFGFTVIDYIDDVEQADFRPGQRGWSLLAPEDAARVATSIAGYWAATPESGWILDRQNQIWNSQGLGSRWRDAWSAAFISWVMCESGLPDEAVFARAIAHHRYIDQAIRARDSESPAAAFIAYDIGELPIAPGDMLCRGNRPAYRSLAERRRHLGEGARTHCDIVVKVDQEAAAFSVIGGNVRGTVGLKLLPGAINADGFLQPVAYSGGSRAVFAHLRLQAEPIPANALDLSPTLQALTCSAPPAGVQIAARIEPVQTATLSATC